MTVSSLQTIKMASGHTYENVEKYEEIPLQTLPREHTYENSGQQNCTESDQENRSRGCVWSKRRVLFVAIGCMMFMMLVSVACTIAVFYITTIHAFKSTDNVTTIFPKGNSTLCHYVTLVTICHNVILINCLSLNCIFEIAKFLKIEEFLFIISA